MWQEVVDWLMGSVHTRAPQSPEEREKLLEARMKALEAKAVHMEREAELRRKMADASARIKAVTPQGRWLRWVVLGAGVLVFLLIIKSCVGG